MKVDPYVPNNPEKKDLRREAAEFIAQNPEVMALFERFAFEMAGRRRRFGISLLTERVRYECHMTWDPDERGFKINNNHRPYIARWLIEKHPSLDGIMRCRQTLY